MVYGSILQAVQEAVVALIRTLVKTRWLSLLQESQN